MPWFEKRMVGAGGIEPPTSSASGKRSPTELRAYRTKILLATAVTFVKGVPQGDYSLRNSTQISVFSKQTKKISILAIPFLATGY